MCRVGGHNHLPAAWPCRTDAMEIISISLVKFTKNWIDGNPANGTSTVFGWGMLL